MEFIANFWDGLFWFLVLLTPLVFVHELGHFLVARWCGVRVDVFSIGFGPELFGWNAKSGTRWKVSAIPLGGYIKMFGEHALQPDETGEVRELSSEEKAVSFEHKRLSQRAAVVFAGLVLSSAGCGAAQPGLLDAWCAGNGSERLFQRDRPLLPG